MLEQFEFHHILLEYYSSSGQKKESIEKNLSHYLKEVVVITIDMCGFTNEVREIGLLHFLSKIAIMKQIVHKSLTDKFVILKSDADNVFLISNSTIKNNNEKQLLQESLELLELLFMNIDINNKHVEKQKKIEISVGIDMGECLFPIKNDFYGYSLNIASKLGEDEAKIDEIFFSKECYAIIKENIHNSPLFDKIKKGIH